MDCVTGTLGSVIAETLPYVCREIEKRIWLKEDINNLDEKLKDLESKKTDIDDKLAREGWNASETVQRWEKNVEEARHKVDKLAEEFRRSFECGQKNRCGGGCRNFWHGEKISQQVDDNKPQKERANGCFGVFPYCWHRHKIRGQVDGCNSKIENLEDGYEEFHGHYAGRPLFEELHPGRYGEESFEEEMPRIKELLTVEKVQLLGILGEEKERSTSFLKLVHNNKEVREHFQDKVFYLEAPSSSKQYIETARKDICKAIGLPASLSKDELYTRWKQKKFHFLLMVADLQEGFNREELQKIVEDIGLPSFEHNQPQIVFSCRSTQVVAAMTVKKTLEEAPGLNVQEEFEKVIAGTDNQGNFCNTDESSKDPVHPLDTTPLFCLACSLTILTGTEKTVTCLIIFSWLFVLTLLSLLLLQKKNSRERRISPAESKLESECSSPEKLESECLSPEKLECFSNEELESQSPTKLFHMLWRPDKTSREPCISPVELEFSSTCHSVDEIPRKQFYILILN